MPAGEGVQAVSYQSAMPWGSPTAGRESLSVDASRTARRNRLIAAGRHPLIDGPIRTDGETCGTCANLRTVEYAGRYHKCALRQTRGPATDVRLRWPGCRAWEAK